ncbi:MAG TPA: DMT family transporter [Mesorhizobium sp.]|jgi:transporter family-2 protein|uniref:DMT family transporter n=1 Tax=Mesorhizobium sp. TaxID=1871066 RepID=UPI002DDCDA08|nr:DMT family transporter [Mesorhizobium sp.]HEV2505434.1 DMT family transporter [Mesorhizobium sp.]
MNIVYVIAAFGLGALISMQPPINAQAAAVLGSPLMGAVCSISISLVVVLVARAFLDQASIDWSRFAALPWWVLVGGVVGALFVLGALMVAPKVGVAAFFVFVVLGQLTGAAVIDHFAGFGVSSNPITWQRAAGILLVFAGAALTQLRF